MSNIHDELISLDNFNLIKYTGHYVLTIDRGMGSPVILEGDNLDAILQKLIGYKEIRQQHERR